MAQWLAPVNPRHQTSAHKHTVDPRLNYDKWNLKFALTIVILIIYSALGEVDYQLPKYAVC